VPYGMEALVADAAALIEAWGRGSVLFVGLSMGGMVAQGLALRRPDLVRGLALAHTVARYDEAARQTWGTRSDTVRREGMGAVVDTVLARYLTAKVRETQPTVVDAMHATLSSNDPQAYAAACDAIAQVDWLDALPKIDTPTLLIAGAHDIGAPPAAMKHMQARIPGSRLVVLPEASHLGPVEQPDAFWTLIDNFVDPLEARAQRPGLAA
jgi:3-oxoadipate enol-lactonase